jgi:hypothetical protein
MHLQPTAHSPATPQAQTAQTGPRLLAHRPAQPKGLSHTPQPAPAWIAMPHNTWLAMPHNTTQLNSL